MNHADVQSTPLRSKLLSNSNDHGDQNEHKRQTSNSSLNSQEFSNSFSSSNSLRITSNTTVSPILENHFPSKTPSPTLPSFDISSSSDIPFSHAEEPSKIRKIILAVRKYVSYIGPGLMVSVAYMDPGNYSTAVAAGAAFKYKLLFSVLISNLMAAFLQILCAKLGSVTGFDLAANCRQHLPKRLNLFIYCLAELSVVATDVAEIVGTSIALNILFGIPLLVGVLLTVIDVLFVLMAYRPNGPLFVVRIFEGFVSLLVFGTVICFAIELSNVSPNTDWPEVFRGFLPSREVVDGDGLYLSLAILGATVMPHSLYLGSGLVQSRLREFDTKMGHYVPPLPKPKTARNNFCMIMQDSYDDDSTSEEANPYRPSLEAIDEAMNFTIAELLVSLFTVALFVNAAILIVSGSALSQPMDDDGDGDLENADLFTIHYLLSSNLSKTAGFVFALALLCSGQSAGVVCTLAGQMVSEGFLKWTIAPGLRRIITRAIAITPCIIVVLISGREGLSSALNGSQVVLSVLLPFVSAPLIYFTSSSRIMRVKLTQDNTIINTSNDDSIALTDLSHDGEAVNLIDRNRNQNNSDLHDPGMLELGNRETNGILGYKDMSNGKFTTALAVLIWTFISLLNFWLIFSSFSGGK